MTKKWSFNKNTRLLSFLCEESLETNKNLLQGPARYPANFCLCALLLNMNYLLEKLKAKTKISSSATNIYGSFENATVGKTFVEKLTEKCYNSC